jgi:hypothetical protein
MSSNLDIWLNQVLIHSHGCLSHWTRSYSAKSSKVHAKWLLPATGISATGIMSFSNNCASLCRARYALCLDAWFTPYFRPANCRTLFVRFMSWFLPDAWSPISRLTQKESRPGVEEESWTSDVYLQDFEGGTTSSLLWNSCRSLAGLLWCVDFVIHLFAMHDFLGIPGKQNLLYGIIGNVFSNYLARTVGTEQPLEISVSSSLCCWGWMPKLVHVLNNLESLLKHPLIGRRRCLERDLWSCIVE